MRYWDVLVLEFLIFSFIGYVCEVVYVSIGKRQLTNRGFLYGPWLPIYGFGGVVVKVFLVPLADIHIWGPILVFVLGVILTSLIEYFGSWMLEKFFSVKLWDYSNKFCNINGRVCLQNSILFGIMGLLCVYFVEPFLDKWISRIPDGAMRIISDVIVVVLITDTIMSALKMTQFKNALTEIEKRSDEIEKIIKDLVASGKPELAEELKKRLLEEVEEIKKKNEKRANSILSSFPTLTSKKISIKSQVEELKSYKAEAKRLLKESREKRKAEAKEN